MKKRTLLSWSSGKDSAWALHMLRQQAEIELVGLFCTVNQNFGRVAMHAVRVELIRQQAERIGLPIEIIPLPHPCSDSEYAVAMNKFIQQAKRKQVECIAFGDIFLEDIREYREKNLAETGITPIFPLWGIPSKKLAYEMIDSGLKAHITCVNPKYLSSDFVGREYSKSFLEDIPDGVDPCGENGEFHSFVIDGPFFNKPLDVEVGKTVRRDGFIFCDVLPEKII